MSDKPFVILDNAKSIQEAEVILAILHGAGIPAHAKYSASTDEFAVAQRAMNLVGVKIEVGADHADAARKVLQEARDAGEFLEGDEAQDIPE